MTPVPEVELPPIWWRITLASLPAYAVGMAVGVLVMGLSKSRLPDRDDVLFLLMFGVLIPAVMLPLLLRRSARLVVRHGRLVGPCFTGRVSIELDQLDVERSLRATVLDRLRGCRKLRDTSGKVIVISTRWYERRDLDDLLAKCFEVACSPMQDSERAVAGRAR
jgi:hypothetical protein